MRLEGPSDTFELQVRGYEFPDADSWWDANWLVVAISATSGGRHWTAESPALLTIDVAELADWLARVATGRDVPEEIGFTEPCLTFTLDRSAGEARELFLNLSHELSPAWLEEEDRLGWGVRLRLAADPTTLLDASAALRQQLQAFPPRGERDVAK